MYINLAIICVEMKLYSLMSTDNQTGGGGGGGGGGVNIENSKGPRTEPWGMPDKSLQTSDKVDPIFIDW